MEKEIVNQVQEAQRVPYRMNPGRNTPRHILIKLTKTKDKERILKAASEIGDERTQGEWGGAAAQIQSLANSASGWQFHTSTFHESKTPGFAKFKA